MEKRMTREEAKDVVSARLATMRAEGKRPSVYVATFGCQQNEADSERLYGLALTLGYEKAQAAEDASLILTNTCAIREHAELKALSVVGSYKHIKEKNPDLLIGVCGCMTAQEHRVDTLKKRYPYVDFTLEPGAIADLPIAIATRFMGGRRLFFLDGEDTALLPLPVERESAHRAWVSIMYGCNNFCSYCIVPYVRGRERSRPADDIIREVKELVAAGAKDITLLGQNVNSYRGEYDFPTLLEKLDEIEGEYVLRMMTSHPKDASDRLVEVIAKGKHIEPHFHLPLQSGSDGILKAMNRKYDAARYLSVVDKLRAARPDIALTSDIIVGFPGETEEDFDATLAILERVKFDSVYSFIYSRLLSRALYSYL
ncbi:MAG: tRNA (N6-isopentenyl adenosine(37)-C2)-methylthiotransferase MiaB, partial [Clostridia bacterium]|nr:tRNA (N6-isopentenyl adenosine(37)-C2)-methylthiotransferase MiaB [Clostridia bacterium]